MACYTRCVIVCADKHEHLCMPHNVYWMIGKKIFAVTNNDFAMYVQNVIIPV